MEILGAVAGPVIGGLLGSGGQQSSQTSQRELPDWLKNIVAGADGKGGLLGDAANLYHQQAAQGGLNDLQRAGMEAQRQFLTSPDYVAGYDQMRQLGSDLLGRPVAGNPFTSGNTGGMGGYGSLAAQGAGGQAAHPSAVPLNFGYNPTPSLMAALNPIQSAAQVTPPPSAQPTQIAPTIEEILAELARQQQAAINDGPHF